MPVERQPKIFRDFFRLFFRAVCSGSFSTSPCKVSAAMLRRESSMTKPCHVGAAQAVFGK
jgi:hypothetical protein